MITKREVQELKKGFHVTANGPNRRKRRESDKITENNRKGLVRVRAVHFPGHRPSKMTMRKQYIYGKMIIHYDS